MQHRTAWTSPVHASMAEARSAERVEVDHPISLTWRDHCGEGAASGTCRDLSSGGASVDSSRPVPCATNVNVRVGADVKVGRAQVRYCIRRDGGYRIGLEFTSVCEACGGRGKVQQNVRGFTNQVQCSACRGSGRKS